MFNGEKGKNMNGENEGPSPKDMGIDPEEKIEEETFKDKSVEGEERIEGRKEVRTEKELRIELTKSLEEIEDKKQKEKEELNGKVIELKGILKQAGEAETLEELEQLKRKAEEINREGEKLITSIDIASRFQEQTMKILSGGAIEKDEELKKMTEMFEKEHEASQETKKQLKEFFEEQKEKIKQEKEERLRQSIKESEDFIEKLEEQKTEEGEGDKKDIEKGIETLRKNIEMMKGLLS